MNKNTIYKPLSGSTLKILAMIAMLIDHAGAIFFPHVGLLRIIGRLAFPIFCFLLTEGFIHTRHLKKYIFRLGIFALISEVPFDLAFYDTLFYPWHQNIFFTLFIGLIVLALYEHYKGHSLLQFIIIISGSILATILHTDYSALGIFMIIIFYILKGQKLLLCLVLLLANGAFGGVLQAFAILALEPIFLYNGKKGYSLKYIFYCFYPVHLLVLYFIKYALA